MSENREEPSAPLTAEGRVMRARAEVERAEAEELATWKAAKRAEQAADQARKQLREAELELELERERRGDRIAEHPPTEPDWFRPRGSWDADEPEHALVEAGGSAPAPESPAAKTFDQGLPRPEERRVDAHAFEIPLFPPRDEDPLPPAFDPGAFSEPDGGRAFEIPFVPDADKIGRYEPEGAAPETAPEPPRPPLGASVYESLVAETGAHLPASLDAVLAPSPEDAGAALTPSGNDAVETLAIAAAPESAAIEAPFDFTSVAVPPFEIAAAETVLAVPAAPAPPPAPAPLATAPDLPVADLPAPAASALPSAPPPAGPASTLPPPPDAAPAAPPFSFAAPFIPGGPAQPPAPPASGGALAEALAAAPPPQVDEQPEAEAEPAASEPAASQSDRPTVPGFYEPPATESVIQAPQWETPAPTPGLYEPPATTVPSIPVTPAESSEPKIPGWHEPYPSAPVIQPKWGDE